MTAAASPENLDTHEEGVPLRNGGRGSLFRSGAKREGDSKRRASEQYLGASIQRPFLPSRNCQQLALRRPLSYRLLKHLSRPHIAPQAFKTPGRTHRESNCGRRCLAFDRSGGRIFTQATPPTPPPRGGLLTLLQQPLLGLPGPRQRKMP